MPIRYPTEESSSHLTNLEDGEDDAGTAVTFLGQVVVRSVARDGVDGAHE